MNESRSGRRWWGFLLAGIGTCLAFYFLSRQVSWMEIGTTLGRAERAPLILGGMVFLVGNPICAVRWWFLLRCLGLYVPLGRLMFVYLGNVPLAKLSPLYGGDLLRAFFLREQVPWRTNMVVIGIEAVLDVMTLAALVLLGAGALSKGAVMAAAAGALCLVPGIVWGCVRWGMTHPSRWSPWFKLVDQVGRGLAKGGWNLYSVIVLSVMGWGTVLLFVWAAFRGLGSGVSMMDVCLREPLVIFSSLLPVSVWGLGIREMSMTVLFQDVAPRTTSAAVGLIHSALSAVVIPLLLLPCTWGLLHAAWWSMRLRPGGGAYPCEDDKADGSTSADGGGVRG
jgi:hypothetical protein